MHELLLLKLEYLKNVLCYSVKNKTTKCNK